VNAQRGVNEQPTPRITAFFKTHLTRRSRPTTSPARLVGGESRQFLQAVSEYQPAVTDYADYCKQTGCATLHPVDCCMFTDDSPDLLPSTGVKFPTYMDPLLSIGINPVTYILCNDGNKSRVRKVVFKKIQDDGRCL
jgi:hypothetical protein